MCVKKSSKCTNDGKFTTAIQKGKCYWWFLGRYFVQCVCFGGHTWSVGAGKVSCRAAGVCVCVCDGCPGVSTTKGRWVDPPPTHTPWICRLTSHCAACVHGSDQPSLGPGEDGASPFAPWLSTRCPQVSGEQLFPRIFFQWEIIQPQSCRCPDSQSLSAR